MTSHALIIDDDIYNIEVLERLLTAAGVAHSAIQDPTLVTTQVQSMEQVDVVFLDLEMPKVDGYKTLEVLRGLLGTKIPIVACTVHTNEIDNAYALGFHSFLGKPLDSQRFPQQLTRILSGEAVWEI